MFCGKCGNQLPDTARFCAKCGAAVSGAPRVPRPQAASQVQPKAKKAKPKAPPKPRPQRAPRPEKVKKEKQAKRPVLIIVIILLILALLAEAGAFFYFLVTPARDVVKALDDGDGSRAVDLYSDTISGTGLKEAVAKTVISHYMQRIVREYEDGERDYGDVKDVLDVLPQFDNDELTELADENLQAVETEEAGRSHYQQAEELADQGDYSGARDHYEQVPEDSSKYEDAQEKLANLPAIEPAAEDAAKELAPAPEPAEEPADDVADEEPAAEEAPADEAVMTTDLTGEECKTLLGVSRKELLFILSMAPEFSEGESLSYSDAGEMLFYMLATTELVDRLTPGYDQPAPYSRDEVNRIFSVLDDEVFTPEHSDEYYMGVTVEDSQISVWLASPSTSYSAEILSVEYNSQWMWINYTATESHSEEGYQNEYPRMATLEKQDNGLYRIVSIEPR